MGWIYEFSGMKEVAEGLSTIDDDNVKLNDCWRWGSL